MNDDTPAQMKSNEYWGKRSGVIMRMPGDRAASPIFKGRKGSNHHDEHQGPHGRQTRFYAGRMISRSLGKHGLSRQNKKSLPKAAE